MRAGLTQLKADIVNVEARLLCQMTRMGETLLEQIEKVSER